MAGLLVAAAGCATPAAPTTREGPIAYISIAAKPGDLALVPYPIGRPHLAARTEGRDAGPAAAPDKRTLAMVTDDGGGSRLVLVDPVRRTTQALGDGQGIDRAPSWSPDGQWIAFASRRDGPQWDLYRIKADGSGLDNVTRTPSVDEGTPEWSPDGTQLAFVESSAGNLDISLVAVDGTGRRKLTTSPADDRAPRWSPDGTRVAFESNRSAGPSMDVWVVDVATGQELNVSRSAAVDKSATWSPDGQRLAFQSNRDGNEEIYSVDANGGRLERLTKVGAADVTPSWSRTGTAIAFLSNRRGKDTFDLWAMRPDGGMERLLATDARPGTAPVWGWSP